MRLIDLFERISTPLAMELYDIIEECATQTRDPVALRALLQARIEALLRSKITDWPPEKLHYVLADPIPGRGWPSGILRAPELGEDEADELPPLDGKTIEIRLFFPLGMVEGIMHGRQQTVQNLASMTTHEFRHVMQYIRAKGNLKPLARYSVGMTRPRVDGKRVGKRGTYTSTEPLHYLGSNIEIDAHAAGAATEIMHYVRRLPVDERRAEAQKILRQLRVGSSESLMQYFDSFGKRTFAPIFGRAQIDPKLANRRKRQRAQVWNLFRKKLAAQLVDYIDAL